jgi:hypothetical protein
VPGRHGAREQLYPVGASGEGRDHDAWQEGMEPALAGLNCRVIPSTSDACVPRNTNDTLANRVPGRPLKEGAHLEQVAQEVEAVRHEHHRLAGQREQLSQSLRTIGRASQCVDVERGARRNGKRIAWDIHAQIDVIRTIAQQENLSETCMDRLEKAERVGPKMQATLAFISGCVQQQVSHLALTQPESSAMHAHLLPAYSLDRVASTRSVTAGEPLRELAERLQTPLFAPRGVLGE